MVLQIVQSFGAEIIPPCDKGNYCFTEQEIFELEEGKTQNKAESMVLNRHKCASSAFSSQEVHGEYVSPLTWVCFY